MPRELFQKILVSAGFTDEFDASAGETRQKLFERAVLLTAVAVLASPVIGAASSVLWWFLALTAEAWLWRTTSPSLIARRRLVTRVQRLMASGLTSGSWASAAVLYWATEDTVARLYAVALIAGILLYCVRACHRFPIHFAVCTLTPASALAYFVISYGDDPLRFVQTGAGFGLLLCFTLSSAISAYRSHRTLQAANAELVSQRRAAEAANQAKSEFLANISHEIRTPLNSVLGMARAIANDPLPPKQRERLMVVQESSQVLLRLLNDLLDLSKIEAGRIELEDGIVDFGSLGAALVKVFKPLAKAKGVAFEMEVAPSAQGPWRGDPGRVRQILSNLLSNGIKFTDKGSVRATIEHVDDYICVRVEDTGPGIPADRVSRLFDKFVQADASTTRRYGGTGLGLAIARELAGLMGGDIAVETELGRGSVFTLRISLQPVAARETVAEAPGAAELDRKLRVLAAEDHPTNRLVLKTLLEQAGLSVHLVDDGQAAVDAWACEDWDVILMDVQMPVMDGPTAAQIIRDQERQSSRGRTPIIALTANAMAHHASEYLASGMDFLVPKPIEYERLLDAIVRATTAPAGAQAAAPRVSRA